MQRCVRALAGAARHADQRHEEIGQQSVLRRLTEDVQTVADLHLLKLTEIIVELPQGRIVIVVDGDIDPRSWKDVMWAVSTRMDPARDITVIENTPIDYLDFASPDSGLGSKIGLDATNKWPPETRREWGKKLGMLDGVIEKVDTMWAGLGLPGSGKSVWDK